MSITTQTPGALDGLVVIALEQAVAAPLCTARLCHAGARVIKIERAGGDFARQYDQAASGESSYFTWINQGKESIVLDVKDNEDFACLLALLQSADVFVQNLAPGAMDRLGLDITTLNNHNPKLITCDISGYGAAESVKHLKAYDLLVQVESGLVSISGGPGEAGRIGVSLCDIGAGVTAHAAILEALIKRGITGRGEAISVSLFDVIAEWMTVPFMHAKYGDGAPKRLGLLHPSIAPYGAYKSGDGTDTLLAIQNEREWVRFCDQVLENRDFASDPRFSSNTERVANRKQLDQNLTAHFARFDATTLRERLRDADIAYGAVNSVDDLLSHPALSQQAVANSVGHALMLPRHPYCNNRQSNSRTPRLGEHTQAIKREFGLV